MENYNIDENEFTKIKDKIKYKIEYDIKKLILINYGREGICEDYLVSLKCAAIKSDGSSLSGFNNLKEVIDKFKIKSNNDLRILLSGKEHSGRTTHLLCYCLELFEEASNLVFYIPSQMECSPIDYIYKKYLCEINLFKQIGEPETAFEIFTTYFNMHHMGRIIIIIDNYDYITTCTEEPKKTFKKIFIEEQTKIINNVDVIVKIREKGVDWKKQYDNISTAGYTKEQIQHFIKEGLSVNFLQYFWDCLYSPLFVKKLIDFAKNPSFDFLTIIEEGLEEQVQLLVKDKSHSYKDYLQYVVYTLIPDLCITGNSFIRNDVTKEIMNRLQNMESADFNRFSLHPPYKESQLPLDPYSVFYEYFYTPIIEQLKLMSESKGTIAKYKWNKQSHNDYFYSLGLYNRLVLEQDKVFAQKVSDLSASLETIQRVTSIEDLEMVITNFRHATILRLLLLRNKKLNEVKNLIPNEIIKLFCGIAEFYEFIGNQEKKYEVSKETLDLLIMPKDDLKLMDYKYLEMINTMSYYIIKYSNSNNLTPEKKKKYDEDCKFALRSLECVQKIIIDLNDQLKQSSGLLDKDKENEYKLLESKVYGNLGAYYYKTKDFINTYKYYELSLNLKDTLSKSPEIDDSLRKRIKIGIIRSKICFGSYYFMCGGKQNYEKSVKEHKEAIKLGNETDSIESLPSYSRIVGSLIQLANFHEWTEKKVRDMIGYLDKGMDKMGISIDNFIIDDPKISWFFNLHELEQIQKKCEIIIEKIKESGNELLIKEDIRDRANKILTVCKQILV